MVERYDTGQGMLQQIFGEIRLVESGTDIYAEFESPLAAAGLPPEERLWVGLRGKDLNLRPSGYEPDELPDCSTPRQDCKYSVFARHRVKPTAGNATT